MPISNPPAVPSYIVFGSYTGDNADNRAIPHGLGRVPKLVLLIQTDAPELGTTIGARCHNVTANTTASGQTALNSTNFYVSNTTCGMNAGTIVYNWVAIG